MMNIHRLTEGEIVYEQRYTGQGHTGDIDQLCWNLESPNMLATASMDRHVKVWDVRYVDPVASVKLENENITINWSNDGSTIGVADRADLVSFLDTRAGFRVLKDHKFRFEVGEIAWNKEDDLFFVTSGEGKIHVLGYPDLQSLMVIDAFASPCVCIRFDPTGERFAVGSNDAITSLWDTENLICYKCIDRLEWPIKTVSFTHDSKYLASGSEDLFIDICDVETGEQVFAIKVDSATLSLDFHPTDYILAYALDEEKDFRNSGTIKVMGLPDSERRRNHN